MTQAGVVGVATTDVRAETRSVYIAGRAYDAVFFLGAPMLALAVAAVLGVTRAADHRFWLDGGRTSYVELSLGALVNAHLVAVFFRSHANRGILRRHPIRFLVVPPILFGLIASSEAVMLVTSLVVVFWDVYHSALQTFGFARIYDRRAGNPPNAGRRLDYLLNLLLYVGPILGGASMLAHFGKLTDLEALGVDGRVASAIPTFLDAERHRVAGFLIAGGVAFVGYYVATYARLAKGGYRVAWPKVWLLASTGLCSIVAWGMNPWGLAFLITNLFHSVQYLGLVWWSEGDRIRRASRLRKAAPFGFILVVVAYGLWAHRTTPDARWGWALAQTVALMHFWYDGFVWSVSKRDV